MKTILIAIFSILLLAGCKDNDGSVQHNPHKVSLNFSVSNSVNTDAFELYTMLGNKGLLTSTIASNGTDTALINYTYLINESLDEHPKKFNFKVKPKFFSESVDGRCNMSVSLIVDDKLALEIPTQTLRANDEIVIAHIID